MYRVPNEIHSELCNWSAWCWQGAWPHPLPRTQCGSIEGDYRTPPGSIMDDEEAPPRPRIRPNERHARVVDGAWRVMCRELPGLVLKAEYPGHATSGRDEGRMTAAAGMRMTVQQYEAHLYAAVVRVDLAVAEARKARA